MQLAPPQPLPDRLQGERWQFASLPGGEVELFLRDRPIPIVQAPADRLPLTLGLASTLPIPGVVIEGGRRSILLARWLEAQIPKAVQVVRAELSGLILTTDSDDRWVLVTFNDEAVKQAAAVYQQRQQASKGLHFLLVQPDNTGVTYTGFWLLQILQA